MQECGAAAEMSMGLWQIHGASALPQLWNGLWKGFFRCVSLLSDTHTHWGKPLVSLPPVTEPQSLQYPLLHAVSSLW